MNNLFTINIRSSKQHSAFIYFTLESNEGLCFYSTLKSSIRESYRDICIQGDISFKTQVIDIIKNLSLTTDIQVIQDCIME